MNLWSTAIKGHTIYTNHYAVAGRPEFIHAINTVKTIFGKVNFLSTVFETYDTAFSLIRWLYQQRLL